MNLKLDSKRFIQRLNELSKIGETDNGITRLAYSNEEVAAKKLVINWLEEDGLTTRIDPAGNVIACLKGSSNLPAIMIGSHLDTVVEAGPLDGAYGVVGACEVATIIAQSELVLNHDLVIAGFSNEEGARGTPGMVGSMAIAGILDPIQLGRLDDEGISLFQRILEGGGQPDKILEAKWSPEELLGFLELHIEQGPILEARNCDIGVVEAITGRANLEFFIKGQANHAGTTPMDMRHDSLAVAAQIITEIENVAKSKSIRVATVGFIECFPNVRNVIPGIVHLGADLRDEDQLRIDTATTILKARSKEIAQTYGVEINIELSSSLKPAYSNPELLSFIEQASFESNKTILKMTSGAGHDSQILSNIANFGMIFVPSKDGISHSPRESSSPEDLIGGVEVLLGTVLRADQL